MKYSSKLLAGTALVLLSACSMMEPWQGDSPKGLRADEKLLTPIAEEQAVVRQEGKISFVQKKEAEESENIVSEAFASGEMPGSENSAEDEEQKVVTVTQRVSQTVTLTTDQVSTRDENNYGDADGYVVETKTFYPPEGMSVSFAAAGQGSDGAEETASVEETVSEEASVSDDEMPRSDETVWMENSEQETVWENDNALLMAQVSYPLYVSDLTEKDRNMMKDVVRVFETGAQKVVIVGYASYKDGDSVATQKMNISLAVERARKAASELIALGIREENIEIHSAVVKPSGFGKGRRTEVYLEF